jgi:hypothetical protein
MTSHHLVFSASSSAYHQILKKKNIKLGNFFTEKNETQNEQQQLEK